MNPKFSIIIPVFNSDKFLVECIESMKVQSYSNFEAIFIDDGSTDNSYNIVKDSIRKKDFDIKLIRQENNGVSSARNKALQIAKGEYIFFLDSDDKLPCDALEILQKKIEENPQVDFILGNHITMDSLGRYFSKNLYFEKRKKYVNTILGGGEWMKFIVAGHGNIWGYLLKKNIIEQEKLQFNEKVTIAEDLLFLMKYISGRKGIFIEENTYIYRYGRVGSLSNVRKINIKEIYSCMEFLKESKEIASMSCNFSDKNFQDGLVISVNYMARRCLGIICHLPNRERIILLRKLKSFKSTLPLTIVR